MFSIYDDYSSLLSGCFQWISKSAIELIQGDFYMADLDDLNKEF